MCDLSLQAGNDALFSAVKEASNKESEQIKQELTRINETTTFDGEQVFDQTNDSGDGAKFKINLENIDGVNSKLSSVSYLDLSGAELVMTIDLDDF